METRRGRERGSRNSYKRRHKVNPTPLHPAHPQINNEMCEVCAEMEAINKCPNCQRYTCGAHTPDHVKIPTAQCNRCWNLSVTGRLSYPRPDQIPPLNKRH